MLRTPKEVKQMLVIKVVVLTSLAVEQHSVVCCAKFPSSVFTTDFNSCLGPVATRPGGLFQLGVKQEQKFA